MNLAYTVLTEGMSDEAVADIDQQLYAGALGDDWEDGGAP